MFDGEVKEGSGMLGTVANWAIKKLPLPPMHLEDHNFTGPWTNPTLQILKGVEPRNKLDYASRRHDVAYELMEDPAELHEADYILQREASNIARDKDTSKKLEKQAQLVDAVMGAKRYFGTGMKKENYEKIPVNLDEK
ncbi:unnamed protein product, partial [Allacma fusca]